MADPKTPDQDDSQPIPAETEESGGGYGNNAGQQGAGEIPDETAE